MEILNAADQHTEMAERTGRRWSTLACAWLALAGVLWAGQAAGEISREYQIKAVFLYNFAQFTDWPTNAFADTNSPLVIGVLGSDPFGDVLDETLRGEVVRGRTLKAERYRTVEEVKTCHILFVGQSEARQIDRVLELLKGRPILTVSEIEGSARRGMMVRFVTEHNRVRFRINPAAIQEAGLTLSSQLLRAAEIVETDKK
jgi:hypothetical protein